MQHEKETDLFPSAGIDHGSSTDDPGLGLWPGTPPMFGSTFATGDVAGKLVIIHTNDTHGRDVPDEGIMGTAAVAQLKKDYQAAGQIPCCSAPGMPYRAPLWSITAREPMPSHS